MADEGKRAGWLTGESAEARPFVRGYQAALFAALACSLLRGPTPLFVALLLAAAFLLGVAFGKNK